MEATEEPKKTNTRKKKVPAGDAAFKAVALEGTAHASLTKAAKKRGLSNAKFASAAILFFTESGLDPTAERPAGLAHVNEKVTNETLLVRKQNAEIGTRLISIMRTWEKNLYTFLQQQQQGTLNYLEQIENNIIRHQVAIEASFLSPMLEQMVKANLEAYMGRAMGEKNNLQLLGKPQTDWAEMHKGLNANRDRIVVEELRALLQANAVAAPGRAPKPVVAPIPKVVVTTQAPATPVPGAAPGAGAK